MLKSVPLVAQDQVDPTSQDHPYLHKNDGYVLQKNKKENNGRNLKVTKNGLMRKTKIRSMMDTLSETQKRTKRRKKKRTKRRIQAVYRQCVVTCRGF